eukprot:520299_1
MAPNVLYFVSLLLLVFVLNVDTAGAHCGSVQDALELNLKEWEKPRHATPRQYGAGMRIEYIETDVLVAGVGSAGVSAALSSARNGAKVTAVQSRKVLGGNASSESKLHMVGAIRENIINVKLS